MHTDLQTDMHADLVKSSQRFEIHGTQISTFAWAIGNFLTHERRALGFYFFGPKDFFEMSNELVKPSFKN